ncbi:MAG: hypothetical protein APR54_00635 [Candidatus Cloacimonas sp. SDB]|nr:MAG: hypothetical protein APR54_00635 [Candidatus Cloacimonas sp. SDB]
MLNSAVIEINNFENTELFTAESESNDRVEINFSLDQFELEDIEVDNITYKRISYQGEGEFALPGKPDLPRFSRLIAIPNTGNVHYNIIAQEQQILSGIKVYPRQALEETVEDQGAEFIIDEKFYSGKQIFPAETIEIGEPAIMRDLRVVSVTVNPFSYDPVTGDLTITENIEFEVTTAGAEGANIRAGERKRSQAFEPLYRSSILNYETTLTRDIEYQQPSYLFIYPSNDQVENYLSSLAEWKHQKGFEVYCVSTAETGTSLIQIKNFIENAYFNWEPPPEFVCLVADANGTFFLPTGTQGGGPGDQYYATLEGNDILADVYMGRISYNTTNELATIISKILNYEKYPYTGNPNWFNKALLVGDPSSSGVSTITTNLYIKDIMENYSTDYGFDEIYSSPFVSGMNSSLNNGVFYYNYRGYLNTSGWGNGDINSLNNGYMLPAAVIITCGTGNFTSSSGDALSEYFVKAGSASVPKGAVACVGTATMSTHTCFNNCVSAGIATGIFIDEIYNMGGALTRGKLGLYLSYPGNPSGWVDNFSYWNNLMGDPGMELWTGVPEEFSVTFNDTISLGSNFVEVSVSEISGTPVENAWVTILKGDDEIFSTGYTDAEGNIYLPLSEDVSGEVTLTVTKHNHVPYIDSFTIQEEDQFLSIDEIFIDDDEENGSFGNGDGLINPGEIIELGLNLINSGREMINGVNAQLSSDSEAISLLNDYADYGDIAGGEVGNPENYFIIQFNPDIPGGTRILFELLISDDSENFWLDRFELYINGPLIEYSGIEVSDSGNGVLDPGETAEVNLVLFNSGEVDITSLSAVLNTRDERIIVNDSLGYYDQILAGSETSNSSDSFELSVDVQTIPGAQIWFDLYLFNEEGFEQNLEFYIEIGVMDSYDPLGPDAHGYYIYDDSDADYSLAPVYNWIEIDPDYGGSGTILNLNDNGNTGDIEDVDLPENFRFIFYGQEYSLITVCSNGWIAPGGTDNYEFMNWHIPGFLGPSPMIAPFWDDLKIGNGNVCYYYEIESRKFIIEWSHLQNEYNNDEETFQVILFDSLEYPSITGDSEILFQYKVVNNVDQGTYNYGVQHGLYASVGIEDPSSTIGLEYTFNNEYPAAAAPLQNEMALLITTNQALVVDPPIAVIDQEEITFSIMQGETGSTELEISNLGEANLVYNIQKRYVETENSRYRDEGGPDNYGYVWIDSNEENGPEFNWIDITASGIQVEFDHNDEGTELIQMDFEFNFYGAVYDQFRINPNGWIGFGSDNSEWQNSAIPVYDAPRPALLPFWDDLYPYDGDSGGGNVYYYSTADSLVVLFDNVDHFEGNYSGTYDFEAVIYADGEILFQYRTVSGDIDTATIGIQNAAGDDGLMIAYNEDYVENDLAVRFRRVIDWLVVTPLHGVIATDDSNVIDLTIDASELLPGHFLCDLNITTNDPMAALINVPVNLYLNTQEQNIYVDSTYLDFGEVDINESVSDSFTVYNLGIDSLYIVNIDCDNPDFTFENTGFALGYNQSENIIVNFSPTSLGQIEAVLSVISNDPDEPVVYITLRGFGTLGVESDDDVVPLVTELRGNFPNPFNPKTLIEFALASSGPTELEIYNIKGEKICSLLNTFLDSGIYRIEWDGRDNSGRVAASGIYFYRLQTNEENMTKKMLLLK